MNMHILHMGTDVCFVGDTYNTEHNGCDCASDGFCRITQIAVGFSGRIFSLGPNFLCQVSVYELKCSWRCWFSNFLVFGVLADQQTQRKNPHHYRIEQHTSCYRPTSLSPELPVIRIWVGWKPLIYNFWFRSSCSHFYRSYINIITCCAHVSFG